MSNFQPQPAWISASTAETGMRTRAFIRSVYAWMFGGLLLTAFSSVWVVSSKAISSWIRRIRRRCGNERDCEEQNECERSFHKMEGGCR